MSDPQKLSAAIATLKPIAQAIVDVSDNAAILGELEDRIAKAKQALERMQTAADELQAKAKQDYEGVKAREELSKANAIAVRNEANDVLEKAKLEAAGLVAAGRRDAAWAAESTKQSHQAELDNLAAQIEASKVSAAEYARKTAAARAEHDAVQASMASLKTRLG